MASAQDLGLLLNSLQSLGQAGFQMAAYRQNDRRVAMAEQAQELEKARSNVQGAEAMVNLGKIPDPKMRVAAFNMIAPQLGFDPKNPATAEFGKMLANQNMDTVTAILQAGADFGLSKGQIAAFGQSAMSDPAGTMSAIMKTIDANMQQRSLDETAQRNQDAFRMKQLELQAGMANNAADNSRQDMALMETMRHNRASEAMAGVGGGMKPLAELGVWNDPNGNKAVWFTDKQGNMTLRPLNEAMAPGQPAPQGNGGENAPVAAATQPTTSAPAKPGSVGGFSPPEKPLTEQQSKTALNLQEAMSGNAQLNAFMASPEGKKWFNSGVLDQGVDLMLGNAPQTAEGIGSALGGTVGAVVGGAAGVRAGHPYQGAAIGAYAGKEAGRGMGASVAGLAPQWASKEGKTYTAATAAILAGFGFQQSGAATAEHEFERAKTALIPQPGDPAELIAEKARRRAIMIEGTKSGLTGTQVLDRLGIPAIGGGSTGEAAAATPTAEATRPNVTKAEYDALPKGATFWWGGQPHTKE